MEEITTYSDVLNRKSRKNTKPKGFTFDVDTFENLVDCWTPMDEIPVILNTTKTVVGDFCHQVYGMGFPDAYNMLTGITNAFMRKALKNLTKQGNGSAMGIVTKHFMGLKDEEESKAINIKIVNDLNTEEGDD